jgi:hypothetical protein
MSDKNGQYLSLDQIRTADDIQEEDVEVPEWGGKVRVRGMTGTQRDKWENDLLRVRGNKRSLDLQNARARLVARTCVQPVFSVADAEWLGMKSAAALERVFDVARRLSGLTDTDIEELTKDLGEEQSVSSGSA